MAAFRTITGRISKKRTIAVAAATASLGALLLATEVPSLLLPVGGGSAALAELLGRSPGSRVGGVALKAKERRASYSPIAGVEGTAASNEGAPANPVASVLGVSPGPEGDVPTSGPFGPGGFPTDFAAPDVPNPLDGVTSPGPASGTPGFGGTNASPGFGGAPIFGVGPGSGGGGGLIIGDTGGTGGGPPPAPVETGPVPTPSETPPVPLPTGSPTPQPTGTQPGPLPTDTVPVGPGPIPEPSTWLMLIAGFGTIGAAMRRKRRVALA